ncbi:hypothetical protein ROA7450_03374 [Roseovarius albus]|uniref:Uncharacterized protein n=1 Tax=Roseovarius albus TaxID=1247867 RepID=A0A1X6ZXG5_9RHOB|nr:hypothetical protein [Roseovarius albus]SLN64052.1 hypothetical protein ROA7450_03374 [Roseovarius albus]
MKTDDKRVDDGTKGERKLVGGFTSSPVLNQIIHDKIQSDRFFEAEDRLSNHFGTEAAQ